MFRNNVRKVKQKLYHTKSHLRYVIAHADRDSNVQIEFLQLKKIQCATTGYGVLLLAAFLWNNCEIHFPESDRYIDKWFENYSLTCRNNILPK